jgi:hypothetical protein
MLCKYAPATDMVGDWPVDGLYGAGGGHLQMGRRRRGGSLLRPVLSGCRKNRHGGTFRSHLIGSAQCSHAQRTVSERSARRPQLHRIFDHLAGPGANLFRRRCRGRALESQPIASAQSGHHLAFERQGTGFGAGRRVLSNAAPGSRHVFARRHHHRPANQRIRNQQQRDFLRASALGAVAAVASEKIAISLARPEARLVG